LKRALIPMFLALTGCARPAETVLASPSPKLALVEVTPLDTAPKEQLRLVPQEVYMRTYLQLFGVGPLPIEVQKRARAGDGSQLFDSWDDYVSALGFPDYRLDAPRQTQTNAFMVAAFERLGIALCDRAVLHDLPDKKAPPMAERSVFAFDLKPGTLSAADFATRFDVLHRTFLGYPERLVTAERVGRFYALYTEIEKNHTTKTKLSPAQAGWAAVCYGLVRHPEFHLY
jgi:hypothetical protein